MKIISINKFNWLGIIVIWVIFQLVFLGLNGINTEGEATKYLEAADNIRDGAKHLPAQFILYAGYIALLTIVKSIGLSYRWMYALQLLFSLFALRCFVGLLCQWLTSKPSVFLTVFLYCSCPFIQSWVSFLYTDSIFASLLMIGSYFLFFQKKNGWYRVGFWSVLLLIPFFRPIGFLFILVAIFYWLIHSPQSNWLSILLGTLYLMLVTVLTAYIFSKSKGYYYAGHNAEANVICGVSSNLTQYIKVPYQHDMSLARYFTSNPKMTFFLFSERLFKAFWLTRTYFTQLHNLLIIMLLLPYYFLAITGVFTTSGLPVKYKLVSGLGILLFITPIIILCVEWNNRFTLPVFIFLFLFIGTGSDFWFEKIRNYNLKRLK